MLRGRWPALLLIAAVLVALVPAGLLARAGWEALDSRGPQPETALPATTVAFARVDLDPPARQKVAALRLAHALDDELREPTGDVRTAVLEALPLQQFELKVDQVSGWAGDRAGLAVVPGTGRGGTGEVVVALRVQDTDRMRTDLTRARDGGPSEPFGFATVGEYVVLASSQGAADVVAEKAARSPLAGDRQFATDVAGFDDGVALIWSDLGGLDEQVSAATSSSPLRALRAPFLFGQEQLRGRAVLGVSLSKDGIEASGQLIQASYAGTAMVGPRTSGDDALMRKLPAGTAAAASFAGLGPAIASFYEALPDAQNEQFVKAAGEAGLTLPNDLTSLLGHEAVVALAPHLPKDEGIGLGVAARTRTDDPVAASLAARVVAQVLAIPTLGMPVTVNEIADGVTAGTDLDFTAEVSRDGELGSSEGFESVMVDVDSASVAAYVDLSAAKAQVLYPAGLGAVRYAGLVVSEPDGVGVARVEARIKLVA